jgi:hypothetical protein
VTADPAHKAHFDAAQKSSGVISGRDLLAVADLDQQMDMFAIKLSRRVPRVLLRKLPRFAFVLTDQPWAYVVGDGRAERKPSDQVGGEKIQYLLASEVASAAVVHDWGWADLSIGARFRARVAPGYEGKEIWFWIIPMLGGEGYLTLRTLWFLRPRALEVWWGRRLEVLDYLRSVLSGRFMQQVVRKKTSSLSQT